MRLLIAALFPVPQLVGGTFSFALTFCLAVVFCLALTRSAEFCAADEPDFPYQAIVLAERATVHSGPGSVHYATDELEQGRTVEVYRHDPAGWCAIRPPQGSFSLVPESALEIVDDGVGRVREEDLRTWVGTRLGAVDQPLWQVKLKRDELIEVLGEVSWPDPAGHSTLWYQIAPPAGEFRWVRISDLQLPDRSLQLPDPNRVSAANQQQRFADNRRFENQVVSSSQPVGDSPNGVNQRSDSNVVQAGGQPGPREIPSHLQNMPGTQTNNLSQTNESFGANLFDRSQIDPDVRQASADAAVQNAVARRELNPSPLLNVPEITAPAVVNSGWRRSTSTVRPGGTPAMSVPENFSAPAIPGGDSSDSGVYTGSGSSRPSDFQSRPVQTARRDDSLPTYANDSVGDRTADIFANNSSNNSNRPFSDQQREPVDLSVISAGPIGDALQELDIRLSQEMLESPGEWRLESIRDEADRLRDEAVAMGDRAYAERLQDKLRNCFYLREEHRRHFGSGSNNANGPIGTGAVTSPGNRNASPRDVMLGTTYDAHGRLAELLSSDSPRSAPSYVLKDAAGKITHHIRGTPGLNLHVYLNKEIGIIGQRGYNRRLQLDHVTAERVIELAKLR